MEWLVEQEIVDNAASYEDSVNPSFLEAIKPADRGARVCGDPANGEALFTS